jgi:hypothetical protein
VIEFVTVNYSDKLDEFNAKISQESRVKYSRVLFTMMLLCFRIVNGGLFGLCKTIGISLDLQEKIIHLQNVYTNIKSESEEARIELLHSLVLQMSLTELMISESVFKYPIYSLVVLSCFNRKGVLSEYTIITQLLAKVEYLVRSCIGYEISREVENKKTDMFDLIFLY